MTQEDFSTMSSRTYVSMLERGERSPTLAKINELSAAMKIHPLTLLALAYAGATGPAGGQIWSSNFVLPPAITAGMSGAGIVALASGNGGVASQNVIGSVLPVPQNCTVSGFKAVQFGAGNAVHNTELLHLLLVECYAEFRAPFSDRNVHVGEVFDILYFFVYKRRALFSSVDCPG